jgi:hypothetical protein
MAVEQLPPSLVPEHPGMLGRSHNVGEQHRGQQPLGASGLELQGVDDHVADASREVDLVAVGGLLEVRGLPGRLTPIAL